MLKTAAKLVKTVSDKHEQTGLLKKGMDSIKPTAKATKNRDGCFFETAGVNEIAVPKSPLGPES